MIRVLYLGAANLGKPTSGLDLASRAHFEEISDDPRLTVTAISVSPYPLDPAAPPRRPAIMFATDMLTVHAGGERLRRKLGLLARGGILFQSGLLSNPARAAIRAHLAERPEMVVVDNVSALSNLPFLRLLGVRLRGRTRILVLAHDASAEVLRDHASIQSSRLKNIALRLHALHCQLYESAVFAIAHRVVFLSEIDRGRFRFLRPSKTEAMCLVLDEPAPGPGPVSADGDYLVFVGSPAFFANAFAIDWLTYRFAPLLLAAMPHVQIRLVGKGTDRADIARPSNMVGLGFVETAAMHELLRRSAGLLSPVIHGSGIKIKVLEAIASGCAIFATASSLRGYEFMALDPLLDVDDPQSSVDRVCEIIADPARLASYKRSIQDGWDRFKSERRGKLTETIHRLVADA